MKKIIRDQKVLDSFGALSKLIKLCSKSEKLRIRSWNVEIPPPLYIPGTFLQQMLCWIITKGHALSSLEGGLFFHWGPTSFWTWRMVFIFLTPHCHSQTIFLPSPLKLILSDHTTPYHLVVASLCPSAAGNFSFWHTRFFVPSSPHYQ